jgi:putative flippase GtrA
MKETRDFLDFIFKVAILLACFLCVSLGFKLLSATNTLFNIAGILVIIMSGYLVYQLVLKSLTNKNKKEDEK